jgi:hypothetical protein
MTAWTDEFHFIKHSQKGNKFAFCEFCRKNVVLQNFILNTVSDWFNDKEFTNGSFRCKLTGKRLRTGPK